MKTGILFDLDGTLLDTLEDLTDAVNHTMTLYGFPTRSRQEVRRFVGNGARQLIRLSLPPEQSENFISQVLGSYQTYYSAHDQVKTGPYPGILQAMETIRQRYPVAVVSNKPHISVAPLCKAYFGDVYALGESPDCPRKPAPDMLFRAMKDLGVDRAVYIGDSEVDVQTAKNAGIPCISVLWGFRDEDDLTRAGATHFCRDPENLPDLIQEILK